MGAEFDVVIVGCGPAGSTAGFLLSKSGHSVLMLDKATFPRSKLCGGLIPRKTTAILENIFGVDIQTLEELQVIDYSSTRYEVFSGSRSICLEDIDLPFHFVKREKYDTYFLDLAREAGADVREGDACMEYIHAKREVVTASGAVHSARCIIGADGIHSLIRSKFPDEKIHRAKWYRNLAATLETYFDRDVMPRYGDLDHPVLFYRTIPWGYAWLFPNSDRIVAGIGGLMHTNRGMLKKRFGEFLDRIGLELGDNELHGWVCPYGCALSDPSWGTTLLVGDAGGYADPFFGEGIYFAHHTGQIAASAVQNWLDGGPAPDLTYNSAIRDQVLPEMTYGKLFRGIFFGTGEIVHPALRQLFLSAVGPYIIDIIHGKRSYRWLRRI